MAHILADVEWNRRRTRARLRFEDGASVTLEAATMREVAPRPGQVYESAEIAAWESADARVRAREGALRLLDHRGRSVGELRRSLLRRGHDEEAVRQVVDALSAAGLLDDAAYAEAYVRGRIARRPRGARALVLELRRRSVSDAIAEAAVARVFGEEGIGEADLARQAARGWLSRQAPAEVSQARAGEADARERLYRRARGWLQRRGFAGDIAHEQVARLLGEDVGGG
jgi:regulatory protein